MGHLYFTDLTLLLIFRNNESNKVIIQYGGKAMDTIEGKNNKENKILVAQEYQFNHKSYEVRLEECNGNFEISKFDWGNPVGREFF